MPENLVTPVQRGFTLIELLVVMGIIGLLVMLLMPAVNYAIVVAQGVATRSTFNRIEAGLAGFYGDFGVYPPSDNDPNHEPLEGRTAFGYNNLARALGGPDGTGWGTGWKPKDNMPFGGTGTEKFGPYFEGGSTTSIDDAFRPPRQILYFRYEQSGNPEATTPTEAVYDFNDNKATDLTKGEEGFTSQGNLMMLLRRRETYQYVRRDYVLISAGPDRVFGYRVGPDANGDYTFATSYTTGAYCDDLANFKYEQY